MADNISAEVYGFISWIVSFVAYGVYLLWALVPDITLHSWGVTYYPDKYWAIAVPAYMIVSIICAFLAYNALNFITTKHLNSFNLVTDEFASGPQAPRTAPTIKQGRKNSDITKNKNINNGGNNTNGMSTRSDQLYFAELFTSIYHDTFINGADCYANNNSSSINDTPSNKDGFVFLPPPLRAHRHMHKFASQGIYAESESSSDVSEEYNTDAMISSSSSCISTATCKSTRRNSLDTPRCVSSSDNYSNFGSSSSGGNSSSSSNGSNSSSSNGSNDSSSSSRGSTSISSSGSNSSSSSNSRKISITSDSTQCHNTCGSGSHRSSSSHGSKARTANANGNNGSNYDNNDHKDTDNNSINDNNRDCSNGSIESQYCVGSLNVRCNGSEGICDIPISVVNRLMFANKNT